MFQGMMTATSDHPAVPANCTESPPRGLGITHGTLPLGS